MGPNAYGAGEALFDAKNPAQVWSSKPRSPVLKPEVASGKRPASTARRNHLRRRLVSVSKAKWYLYYGCADSRIAVVESGY